MAVRRELVDSFTTALLPTGLLDQFQIAGVIVRWWDANQFDLRTLATHGFGGVIDGWVTTIGTALEDEKSRTNPLGHRLVRTLVPEYLDELAAVEAQRTELEAQISAAATPNSEQDEEPAEADADETVSPAELKRLKAEFTKVRKRQRELQSRFIVTLEIARAALTEQEEQDLVLVIWQEDLTAHLDGYVTRRRRQIIAALENWWDKYAVSLADVEARRDASTSQLVAYLQELGYA